MSHALHILTPDPEDRQYVDRWPAVLDRYTRIFAEAGVRLTPTPWTGPWSETGATLALLAWGYHKQIERWRERMGATSINLINPASVVLWNTDKRYLDELATAGAPTVPTLFADAATVDALAEARSAFGMERLVVKPVVSAGSYHTVVVGPRDPAPDTPGPVMIQAFLEAVRAEGELSLFYFGDRFSHAARKVAAAGDFRVQPQFGGQFTRIEPTVEMTRTAEQVLDAAPAGLVYARVDLIRDLDGRLKLMELEAIEPDLYLDLAPDAGPRLVEAVLAAE